MFAVKFGYEDYRVAGIANGVLSQLSQQELHLLWIHSYPFVEKLEDEVEPIIEPTQENETDLITDNEPDSEPDTDTPKGKRKKGERSDT